jgi:septal ring factor EnvC (AmiA/AmiB activator)
MSAAQLETERQRLLKEKEDNINRLREKILRLQARAAQDKKAKIKEAAAAAALEQKALDDVIVDAIQDVVMGEASVAAGESYCWPLSSNLLIMQKMRRMLHQLGSPNRQLSKARTWLVS